MEFSKNPKTLKKLWRCFVPADSVFMRPKELGILKHFEGREGAIFRVDLFPVESDWYGTEYYGRGVNVLEHEEKLLREQKEREE